ncbi:hypothetical protein ACODYM_29115 [Burkholderia gladioli]|uniref:hypothetical protein n=1 Tax=Burkholderia gladioli TaxID=28095 RepID=UPI003B511814
MSVNALTTSYDTANAFAFPRSPVAAPSKRQPAQSRKAAQKPAQKAAEKPAQAAAAPAKVRDYAHDLQTSLKARIAVYEQKENGYALKHATEYHAAVNACFAKPGFDEIFDSVCKTITTEKEKDSHGFISHKTVLKVIDTIIAIGQGITAHLDGYTRTIGHNITKLSKMTIKDGLVSLSKSIEYDQLEEQAKLDKRYNCSAGTASSQSGSTRMTLRTLAIANINKGKRNDVMTIDAENPRAAAFAVMFEH